MFETYKRAWDGKEWERFSLLLIRYRHGAPNTQPVPDKVKGDLGIECLTSDGCCYQSYAPLEAADVPKAASAMKAKASKDLEKLKKNAAEIKTFLNGKKIRRWILLCPFLDDKAVVKSVAAKAETLKQTGLDILSDDFEGKVHCQEDFSEEIDQIRQTAVAATIILLGPSPTDIEAVANVLDETLDEKLGRGFPGLTVGERKTRKRGFVSNQIRADNALEQLKRDAPELWERAATAIALEEDRLTTVGCVEEGTTNKIILGEQDRLFEALKSSLPNIDPNAVRAIAMGQIGTWLIECPLDFAETGAPNA